MAPRHSFKSGYIIVTPLAQIIIATPVPVCHWIDDKTTKSKVDELCYNIIIACHAGKCGRSSQRSPVSFKLANHNVFLLYHGGFPLTSTGLAAVKLRWPYKLTNPARHPVGRGYAWRLLPANGDTQFRWVLFRYSCPINYPPPPPTSLPQTTCSIDCFIFSESTGSLPPSIRLYTV